MYGVRSGSSLLADVQTPNPTTEAAPPAAWRRRPSGAPVAANVWVYFWTVSSALAACVSRYGLERFEVSFGIGK